MPNTSYCRFEGIYSAFDFGHELLLDYRRTAIDCLKAAQEQDISVQERINLTVEALCLAAKFVDPPRADYKQTSYDLRVAAARMVRFPEEQITEIADCVKYKRGPFGPASQWQPKLERLTNAAIKMILLRTPACTTLLQKVLVIFDSEGNLSINPTPDGAATIGIKSARVGLVVMVTLPGGDALFYEDKEVLPAKDLSIRRYMPLDTPELRRNARRYVSRVLAAKVRVWKTIDDYTVGEKELFDKLGFATKE